MRAGMCMYVYTRALTYTYTHTGGVWRQYLLNNLCCGLDRKYLKMHVFEGLILIAAGLREERGIEIIGLQSYQQTQ